MQPFGVFWWQHGCDLCHHKLLSDINTIGLIWRSECFIPCIILFVQTYRTFHPFAKMSAQHQQKQGVFDKQSWLHLELVFDNNPATFSLALDHLTSSQANILHGPRHNWGDLADNESGKTMFCAFMLKMCHLKQGRIEINILCVVQLRGTYVHNSQSIMFQLLCFNFRIRRPF